MKGFKEEIGQLMAFSRDNETCYIYLYIHTTKEDLKTDKNKYNAESWWEWFNLGDKSGSVLKAYAGQLIYAFTLWHGDPWHNYWIWKGVVGLVCCKCPCGYLSQVWHDWRVGEA